MSATPRPWTASRQDDTAELWCVVHQYVDIAVDLRKDNAELIVRAVNSHDALVKALKGMVYFYSTNTCPDECNCPVAKAQQALRLAGALE